MGTFLAGMDRKLQLIEVHQSGPADNVAPTMLTPPLRLEVEQGFDVNLKLKKASIIEVNAVNRRSILACSKHSVLSCILLTSGLLLEFQMHTLHARVQIAHQDH